MLELSWTEGTDRHRMHLWISGLSFFFAAGVGGISDKRVAVLRRIVESHGGQVVSDWSLVDEETTVVIIAESSAAVKRAIGEVGLQQKKKSVFVHTTEWITESARLDVKIDR